MKMRKLTLMLMLAGCSAVAVDAHALSLGEADLESYLDQPLQAAIPLLQVRDLNTQEILVNLASQEDFDKAGIERSAVLSNLKFQVTIEPGQEVGTLRVFTTQPIKALYLNFLVDVHWPSGHLVREYTLLMDPPAEVKNTTALNNNEASQQPQVVAAVPPSVPVVPSVETTNQLDVSSLAPSDKPSDEPKQVERKIKSPSIQISQSHMVSMNHKIHAKDMLWKIAAHMRPNHSVTVHQTMLAIQKYNPHAFIHGNINLIKTGVILTAPSLKQIKALSASEANQEVMRQANAWRSNGASVASSLQNKSLEAAQLEGNNRNLTPKDKPSSVKGGHVELLSVADKNILNSKKTNAAAAQATDTEQKLALLGEQLDQSTLQLKDKQDRLKDVADQVTTSHKLMALKDDQVIALQSRLTELEKVNQLPPSSVKSVGVVSPEPDVINLHVSAQQQKAVQSLMEKIKQPLAVKASGQVPWYANPWSWIVILAVGGSVAVGSAVAYRRRKAEEVLDEEDINEDFVEETVEEGDESNTATELNKNEEILAQVEVDLAYGRYQRAMKALEQAIQQAPDQIDLRMKLLEVYAQTADQAAFEQQAGQLQALGDADIDGRIAALRRRLIDEQHSMISSVSAPVATMTSSVETQPEKKSEEKNQFLPDFDFSAQESVSPRVESTQNVFTLDDELNFGNALDQMEASLAHEVSSQETIQTKSGEALEALDFPELDDVLPVSSAAESIDHWNMDLNSELGFDSSDMDEIETKLDLARAYVDMGDKEGARDILGEVILEGSFEQQQQAKDLLAKVESL